MLDLVSFNIIKRRLDYIRIANKETIKKYGSMEYNQGIIDLCNVFCKTYVKPKLVAKSDGSIEKSQSSS